MKKSKSITFPYLANSAPTVSPKSVWPIYLSLRPLHSEGIVSSCKTEKNPMCIAHLQMETDCVAGFGGWVGWKLCVNNWWKAWPFRDLGQTNPQLKSSPLTWIPVWGRGPEKGEEDKIMFWTCGLAFSKCSSLLDCWGASVPSWSVTKDHKYVCQCQREETTGGKNISFFLSMIQAMHRTPPLPTTTTPSAIWSGSWFTELNEWAELHWWKHLIMWKIKALAGRRWQGFHCLSPHFVFIGVLTGTNKLE